MPNQHPANQFEISIDKHFLKKFSSNHQNEKIIQESIEKFKAGYTGLNKNNFFKKFIALTNKKPRFKKTINVKINNKKDLRFIKDVTNAEPSINNESDLIERILTFYLDEQQLDDSWIVRGDTITTGHSKTKHDAIIPCELLKAINEYQKKENDKPKKRKKDKNNLSYSKILADALDEIIQLCEQEGRKILLETLLNNPPPKNGEKCNFSYCLKQNHDEFLTEMSYQKPYLSSKPGDVYPYPKSTIDFITRCLSWYLRKKGYIAF